MTNDSMEKDPLPHIRNMSADMKDQHNSVFFAAVSTTRMPMIVSDPNQTDNPIVFANPAFLKMTGYDEHELIGKNCRLLQGPDTDRNVVSQIRTAIESKQEIAVEILNYKKNGSTFWNALFISPVFDQDDNLIYYFASQLDVTRRRDTEEALHQSQKMEAVGQLTGGIAHDFNNLLTVVQGFSEILKVNLNKPTIDYTKTNQAIDAILKATEKGSKLTNQLLTFARKQKLEGRVVNLHDLITHLAPLIDQSLGEGVQLQVINEGESCNSKIDLVQAEMAILNIAVNARDAMDGQGKLTITTKPVTVEAKDPLFGDVDPGDYICITVQDTGDGMDSETLSRITEPFFTTKSEGKGTGLGMSMVYGFIKQSEGSLKIESQKHKGTSVHMLFRRDAGEIEQKITKANPSIVGRQNDRETILMVEDKVEVADFVEYMLTEFGYQVLRAQSAAEALILVEEGHEVNLLFTDITMPAMNGVQLARNITRKNPDIKVLLTTGFSDTNVDLTDNHGAAFELIRKPYRQSEIAAKLRMMFDGPDGVS